jgi:hypothetical protein
MARWLIVLGKYTEQVDAPDRKNAEALALSKYGPSAKVRSVAAEEVNK